MGRKRKRVTKPWCWYCDREFEEEKILIHHQKSKHFRCNICARKLYTAPGLVIHCQQVHKITITEIPNALSHRNNLDMDIYGTEGIPQVDRDEREAKNYGIDSSDGKKAMSETSGMAYFPATAMIPMMAGPSPLIMAPGPFTMPVMHPSMQGGPLMQPPLPLQMKPPDHPLFPSGVLTSTETNPHHASPLTSVPTPLFPSGELSAKDTSTTTTTTPPPTTTTAITNTDTPTTNDNSNNNNNSNNTSTNVGFSFTIADSTFIMHPEGDLSMEELRAGLPKYTKKQTPQQTHPPMIAPPIIQPPSQQPYPLPNMYPVMLPVPPPGPGPGPRPLMSENTGQMPQIFNRAPGCYGNAPNQPHYGNEPVIYNQGPEHPPQHFTQGPDQPPQHFHHGNENPQKYFLHGNENPPRFFPHGNENPPRFFPHGNENPPRFFHHGNENPPRFFHHGNQPPQKYFQGNFPPPPPPSNEPPHKYESNPGDFQREQFYGNNNNNNNNNDNNNNNNNNNNEFPGKYEDGDFSRGPINSNFENQYPSNDGPRDNSSNENRFYGNFHGGQRNYHPNY